MEMYFKGICIIIIAAIIGITLAATSNEIEAKKFIDAASSRYYKFYNELASDVFGPESNSEDIDELLTKLESMKEIPKELVEISEEASQFDLSKIQDEQIKNALQNLREVGSLYVLGEEYFSTVPLSVQALEQLATDKEIEPYVDNENVADHDNSLLAYYPDIQKIFQTSNNAEELQYYWENWREKNAVWSKVNFYSIVEAFQKAAKLLDIPVLSFWYRRYHHADFLQEMERVMDDLKPAYQQMHSFVRQQLVKKYGAQVIDPNGPIPDHLFQQVLEQTWRNGSIVENFFPFRDLPPYDKFVQKYDDPLKLIEAAERFYTSLGFEPLSEEFRKSRLIANDDSEHVDNCRASIFDLVPDVYMKYCSKIDFRKFLQAHGYLAQYYYAQEKRNLPAYYFASYDLQYPVGEAIILSASTPKHLTSIGLVKDFKFTDEIFMNRLLRMGIHTMFNIPLFFVHTKLMNDLLDGTIEMDGVNKHYWKLMEQYAGVEPPTDRSEAAIDFPFKFYTDMEENHHTRKFVSEVIGYQFYRAFCKKNGQVGALNNCDFYGNLSVGNDLKAMMSLGSSKSWHDVIAKVLPENPKLSADALLEYYTPILDWIKSKNTESKVKIGWNATKKTIL